MNMKPTYEELEQRIIDLEKEVVELKQVEDELKESEHTYRYLVENVDIGVTMIDPNHNIIWTNRAVGEWFDKDPAEFLGKKCYEEFEKKEKPCSYCPGIEAMATGQPCEVETQGTRNDGTRFTVKAFPFCNIDGALIGFHEIVEDVSESKAVVDKALRERWERWERYRDIASSIPGVIYQFLLKKDGSYSSPYISESASSILDISDKEVIANPYSLLDMILKEDLDSVNKAIVDSARTMKTWLQEFRIKTKTGDVKWIRGVSTPRLLPGGDILWNGVLLDITDAKHVEEALRESEERFRTIFTNSTDGIIVADPETKKFIYVNPSICRVLGYTEDEMAQMGVLDIHPKNSLEHAVSEFETQARGEKLMASNIPFLKKDGTIIYMDTNASIVKMDEKRRIIGVFRDVTGRRQAEEELRESEEKYRGIFDESIAAVYLFDEQKNFLDSNQAGLDLLGYSREELLSMSITDVDADPVVVLPSHEQLLRGERIINYEHRLKRKDGKVVTVLNNSRPITDTKDHVVGIQSTLIDITKRKQAEDALRKINDELEFRIEKRTEELEIKSRNLEEVNTAMKVLLKKREDDNVELEEKVLANVKQLIEPTLNKLKKSLLNKTQEVFVDILESNLNDIISPFSRSLSGKYLNLTPSEIQIANLLKQGRTSKEIAELLNLSSKTIETHRRNIRKKFGLTSKKANLRTYLLAFQQ